MRAEPISAPQFGQFQTRFPRLQRSCVDERERNRLREENILKAGRISLGGVANENEVMEKERCKKAARTKMST